MGVAFYDYDWQWFQAQCLHFLKHDAPNIRGIAATCLGHIARNHNKFDRKIAVTVLKNHLKDHSLFSPLLVTKEDREKQEAQNRERTQEEREVRNKYEKTKIKASLLQHAQI